MALPEFQVDDGLLFGGQLAHDVLQRVVKTDFIGIFGILKNRLDLRLVLFPRGPSSAQIQKQPVGTSKKKGSRIRRFANRGRIPGQTAEDFLKNVPRIGLAAGKMQHKRIKRLGVVIVKFSQLHRGGCHPYDARGGEICLWKFSGFPGARASPKIATA